MNHGWLIIAACSLFCKAHLYEDGFPSEDKKSCKCITTVTFQEPAPIEITLRLKTEKIEEEEE